jgi:hypothetical protein
MRFFRHVTVFLLLTLWLAAKEHCNLEAAGWLPELCVADCGKGTDQDDGCETFESAQYKSTVDHIKAPAPALLLCLTALVCPPQEMETSPALAPERYAEPQMLVRTWQFVERAAPPSRAPAAIV